MRKIASILTICLFTSILLAKTATAGSVQTHSICLDYLNTTNDILYKADLVNEKELGNTSNYFYNMYCLNVRNIFNALETQKSTEQLNLIGSEEKNVSASNSANTSAYSAAPKSVDNATCGIVNNTEIRSTETTSTETTSTGATSTEPTNTETACTEPTNTGATSTEPTNTETACTEITSTEVASTESIPADSVDTNTYLEFQEKVIELVNKEREAVGLNALAESEELDKVATLKSQDMVDLNYFSHTSPTYGSPFQMLTQFSISYTAAGENIAYGQTTPEEVMNGWMNSSGHRANILNENFTEIGVGIAKKANGQYVWTQTFLRP